MIQREQFLDHLVELSRHLRAAAAQAYAGLGVGSTQAKFLRRIGDRRRVSQAELARLSVTDPALTGRVVQTLIDRGWVRRARSSEDRREYVVELTPRGRRVRQRVETVRARIAVKVARVLNARDHRDFARITKKILEGVIASPQGE
jgi:MarR family transcriptional regulator for hemolysin